MNIEIKDKTEVKISMTISDMSEDDLRVIRVLAVDSKGISGAYLNVGLDKQVEAFLESLYEAVKQFDGRDRD